MRFEQCVDIGRAASRMQNDPATLPRMSDEITAGSRTASVRYRGRIWLALYLGAIVPCLLALVLATPLIDDPWFAFVVLGIPSLISAYGCAGFAFAEAVATVEFRAEDFTLRLPSYRGYFPVWPIQRLEARWADVTSLSRLRVRATLVGLPYDYVLHRIGTGRGEAVLFEALPGISSNTQGASANLPVGAIVQQIAARTGLVEQDCGTVRGGGIWRNLIAPSPETSFSNIASRSATRSPAVERASGQP